MAEEKEREKKSRKAIYKDHDEKRKDQLKLNAIRNVSEETIKKLDKLVEVFGNKKIATLKAIDLLYKETLDKS